jgi:hypothetical protein
MQTICPSAERSWWVVSSPGSPTKVAMFSQSYLHLNFNKRLRQLGRGRRWNSGEASFPKELESWCQLVFLNMVLAENLRTIPRITSASTVNDPAADSIANAPAIVTATVSVWLPPLPLPLALPSAAAPAATGPAACRCSCQ